MTNETYGICESEKISPVSEMNLIEVMDICSNLYLTHLLAVEILGENSEHFSELGESPWIIPILSFDEPILIQRLRQIH